MHSAYALGVPTCIPPVCSLGGITEVFSVPADPRVLERHRVLAPIRMCNTHVPAPILPFSLRSATKNGSQHINHTNHNASPSHLLSSHKSHLDHAPDLGKLLASAQHTLAHQPVLTRHGMVSILHTGPHKRHPMHHQTTFTIIIIRTITSRTLLRGPTHNFRYCSTGNAWGSR